MECIECLMACVGEVGVAIYVLLKILERDSHQNGHTRQSFGGSEIFLLIVAMVIVLLTVYATFWYY